jgi:GTP-binding protein Era
MNKRCGYISLMGLTNAGKSTLLNACVGQKIAGVSRKPQTTRNRILGIAVHEQSQLVFLDTPGFHQMKNAGMLNRMMNQEAFSVVPECQVICYLVDVKRGFTEQDTLFLGEIVKRQSPEAKLYILTTKVDAVKNDIVDKNNVDIMQQVQTLLGERKAQASFINMSSKDKECVAGLLETLAEDLPEGEWEFEDDAITDRSENFVISELIREQCFRLYGEELPYGTGVVVEDIEKRPDIVVVQALLVVNRETHKGMVIGKGGSKIKELGIAARASLEQFYERKTFLELNVKCQVGWVNDRALITEFQGINAFTS